MPNPVLRKLAEHLFRVKPRHLQRNKFVPLKVETRPRLTRQIPKLAKSTSEFGLKNPFLLHQYAQRRALLGDRTLPCLALLRKGLAVDPSPKRRLPVFCIPSSVFSPLIHIPFVTLGFLHCLDVFGSRLRRFAALFLNDLMERDVDIFSHSGGIATDIKVSSCFEP